MIALLLAREILLVGRQERRLISPKKHAKEPPQASEIKFETIVGTLERVNFSRSMVRE